jgi:hypothetical protein
MSDELPANELIKRGVWIRDKMNELISMARTYREDWPEEVK